MSLEELNMVTKLTLPYNVSFHTYDIMMSNSTSLSGSLAPASKLFKAEKMWKHTSGNRPAE